MQAFEPAQQQQGCPSLITDRAYQGGETRQLALGLGYELVVPALRTRVGPWEYDRETVKGGKVIERQFHRLSRLDRLKGFRRVFSRCGTLGIVFLGCVVFALIVDGLL